MNRTILIKLAEQHRLPENLLQQLAALPAYPLRSQINFILNYYVMKERLTHLLSILPDEGDGDDSHYLATLNNIMFPLISLARGNCYVARSR